ncbi:hypothetical protein YO5_19497 [Stutzerimonas stutzeri TS44]|nr:hypothetical protein YO5_19497 [Stutzerimonas stutzeri TS44]
MMRIWRWPLMIGLLSLLGLLAGLVSDGTGDWLSWAALSLPVAIGAKALGGGRQTRRVG